MRIQGSTAALLAGSALDVERSDMDAGCAAKKAAISRGYLSALCSDLHR